MKKILALVVTLLFITAAQAQDARPIASKKQLKVVFHLTTSDTTVQKSLAKQLKNFLVAAPNSKIEVVCHNSGISFLQIASTKQADKIRDLSAKGVDFVACENTMRDRNIKREDLVHECRTVPAGVVEVVMKQDQGWSYIRATE